ncbi:hypothetical protein DFH09DRAFT_1098789 [Mycena vulgaris]|nr:hypothetical protein DFH09DRAFT_1098789 [Mycena vulgaris]
MNHHTAYVARVLSISGISGICAGERFGRFRRISRVNGLRLKSISRNLGGKEKQGAAPRLGRGGLGGDVPVVVASNVRQREGAGKMGSTLEKEEFQPSRQRRRNRHDCAETAAENQDSLSQSFGMADNVAEITSSSVAESSARSRNMKLEHLRRTGTCQEISLRGGIRRQMHAYILIVTERLVHNMAWRASSPTSRQLGRGWMAK